MSAYIGFFPRIDGSTAGVSAEAFDINRLGRVDGDVNAPAHIGKLGWELTDANSSSKLGRYLRNKWGADVTDRDIQDASTNFVTNGLRVLLGPADDVIRGEDDPKLFVPGKGEVLIPQQNLLPLGANKVAYKIRERTGQAQFLEPNNTRGLQRAGFITEEAENGASYYGISWAVNVPEEWEAGILGENPMAERERSAVEALDMFREDISSWGNTKRKIPGFLTLPDALVVLGGQQFSSFVPDAPTMMERLAEFDEMYVQVNDREATHLLAPSRDRAAMRSTFFAGSGAVTVWEKAVEMYDWLRTARWDNRMSLANAAGNASRWVMWTQNQRELYIEHRETMVFGPFTDHLETVFVAIRRHGGVVSRRPERVFNIDFTA